MINTFIALAIAAIILNYGYNTFIAQATGWKVFDAKNTLAYSSVTEKKSLMMWTQGVDRNDVDGKWAKVGKFFFLNMWWRRNDFRANSITSNDCRIKSLDEGPMLYNFYGGNLRIIVTSQNVCPFKVFPG